MKVFKYLLLSLVAFLSCSLIVQKDASPVFDFENVLTESQENNLYKIIVAHEAKTSNEIAIVTTPDWGDKENALFYSVDFANNHGVGKKEKDNGIVIVFSKQQRETRISTGYGMEEILKDHIAKKIIDSLMIPQFKEGKIYEGLLVGTNEIVRFLELPENKIH
jgi:uncharacterized protein